MSLRRHAAALLAAGALLAACGDDDTDAGTTLAPPTSTSPPTEVTTSTAAPAVDPMFAQLCAVLNAALGGEVDVAKTAFDHGPLHTLADEVIDIDRGIAARLLEAKEAVESDLAAATPDPVALVRDLEALTAATAASLVATGTPVSPTCDLETP